MNIHDLGFAFEGSVQTAATEGEGGAGEAAAGEGGEHIVRHAGAGHQVQGGAEEKRTTRN